jgi:hypothetical protein
LLFLRFHELAKYSTPNKMAAKFAIEKANHTGFVVSSLDESLKFFEGLLGFQLLFRMEFAR